VEAHDPGPIGIVELYLLQTQHVTKEGNALGEGLYRDPDVRNSRATGD
jgi:hypothetical protein